MFPPLTQDPAMCYPSRLGRLAASPAALDRCLGNSPNPAPRPPWYYTTSALRRQ